MKRFLLTLAAIVAALALLVYFRPLAVMGTIASARMRLNGIHSETVQAGPYRIRVLVGGEGPPLVLIHGLASKALDWAPLLRRFNKHHRVYAIDLLGYGESDKPDVEYSIAQQTDVVRGAMDALNVRQADVMGWSMGGWIAMKLAAEHPERVRRLILVHSAGFAFPNKFNENTFTPTTLEGMHNFIALQTNAKVPDFLLRDFIRSRRDTRYVVQRGMKSMLTLEDSMEGKLARVTMPVLIVAGTADRIVPFETALRMQHEMPQAKLVKLDGCGHLGLLECGARGLPPVETFMTGKM